MKIEADEYAVQMDAKFAPLEVIDVEREARACTDAWMNQTLCQVNESLIRLGVLQGEFHWHQHDEEDEFFYVVDGRLIIDLEDQTVELAPQQGFTVPRGVQHRTRAPERTVVLMVENDTVDPRGDKS